MKPAKNDTVSYGSRDRNEGETQAPVVGIPGANAAGMQNRILSRKNDINAGPEAKNTATVVGPESANFGLPLVTEEIRVTGKRGS